MKNSEKQDLGHKASIGSLEKIMLGIEKKINATGNVTAEVYVFRAGQGGQSLWGTSYVELTLQSESGHVSEWFKVYSSGYGEVRTTKELKSIFNSYIQPAEPRQ